MATMIKLSQWAENHGINYQTAYRWYKAGKLPAKNIVKTPTGTILVEELVPEYDDTSESESIFTDETQPLNKRLIHAYKFIQANQKENPDIHKERLEEMTHRKQEDVPCEEKEKILKEMNLLSENPFFSGDNTILELISIKQELMKKGQFETEQFKVIQKLIQEKQKESCTEAMKKDVIKLSEDFDLLKEDHDKLMKEIFGDINKGVFYTRIKNRIIHLTFKSIEGLLENAESFEDLKKNYKEYKRAFHNMKWEE